MQRQGDARGDPGLAPGISPTTGNAWILASTQGLSRLHKGKRKMEEAGQERRDQIDSLKSGVMTMSAVEGDGARASNA